MNKSISLNKIPKFKYIVLILLAALLAVYVKALLQIDDVAHLGISALYFLAVGKLVAENSRKISFQTNLISIAIGVILLALILWQATNLGSFSKNLNGISDIFLRMMPFLSAVSIVFIAFGGRFAKHWRELTILFFLAAPRLIISSVYDPSPLTAKAASLILWYSGFDVQIKESVYVLLPKGGVKVFEGCSGVESMCYTLGLSVILLILYPLPSRVLRFITPIVAVLIGFWVNTGRVSLLALLQNWQQSEAFVYWHDGDGALVFGIISVALLGLFYYFLPIQTEKLGTDGLDMTELS